MKKIISLMLAMLMVATLGFAIVGCNKDQSKDTSNITVDVTTPGEDEPKLEVPDKKYDGAEFTVYMGGQGLGVADKFNDWSDTNDDYQTVADAVFKRNKTLEELYDIKISSKEEWGSENGSGKSFQRVSEDYLAEECEFSLYEVGTYAAANLARSGYLKDMNSEGSYINVTKPWWDQGITKDLQIRGRMYYTTGDISVGDNLATHNIYFNKELMRSEKLPNFYELVESGKWTLDEYIVNVKKVAKELNGDDTMNENDRYGAIIWNDSMQATFAGAGQRIGTINDEGAIELTMSNEITTDLITKYTEVCFNRDVTFNYVIRIPESSRWDSVRVGMFEKGQALFFKTILNTFSRLRDAEVDFGILPYPKYNEEQDNYYSYVGASYSVMVCIGYYMTDEDFERNSAIIEAAAYYSREMVTPEYYDYTLKGKFIRDDESGPCLDLIISNRIFDVGMYYNVGKLQWGLTDMMKAENNTFASDYSSRFNSAMQDIEKINSDFLKAGYED